MSSDAYIINCLPLKNIQELESQWLELEAKANNRFFLSWNWIGVWLYTYKPRADVVRAYQNGVLMGLAILVKANETRHRILKLDTLQLNQTGDPEKDQVWIEYNGILSDEEHHESVTIACLDYLYDRYGGWDEFVIGAITSREAQLFDSVDGLNRHDEWGAPTFGINLKTIAESGKNYLETLSRNTRYQIRRSRRKYEAKGELELQFADNVDSALSYFSEIAPLHKKRWGEGYGQSGFANPHFVRFHENLIKTVFPLGAIDVCRLSVDSKPIAYFYNFIYRNTLYFYLSGLEISTDATLKPGLMGHAMCIQHYQDNGLEYYDFMGGGDRYKASLGKRNQELVKIRLQKRFMKFKLEHCARRVKRSITKYVSER